MLELNFLIAQYIKNIEPGNPELLEYFYAYQQVIEKFGYAPIIEPGQIQLLGWDVEYRCGAALANFIDQILIRRLNDFMPDNDRPVILDCGANIGFSSLVYKRQFPNAKITAFEPDPEFIPLLRRNLERNGASDVEVVEAAVWVENGSSQWSMEGIDGSHLGDTNAEGTKTVTVRTIDLGDYLNQPIDLLKMDIEGAEYEVIGHLKEKLANVKSISLECHLNQGSIISFSKMLEVLSSAGFKVSINSFGAWRDLIRQPQVLKDHYENYLLVSAWRDPAPNADTSFSWVPASGILPIMDYANNIQSILNQYAVRESEIETSFQTRETEMKDAFDKSQKELQESISAIAFGRTKTLLLGKKITHEDGYCWMVPLPTLKSIADASERPVHSKLLLFENDKLLVPPHSLHEDIRTLGGGRYSHWNENLYFSSSDGSDPNNNGRKYRVVYPE